jgi:hypothetical protein
VDDQFDQFSEMLSSYEESHQNTGDSAAYITDTLYLAWESAKAIFGHQARPEHAIRILELFLTHKDNPSYAEFSFRKMKRKSDG